MKKQTNQFIVTMVVVTQIYIYDRTPLNLICKHIHIHTYKWVHVKLLNSELGQQTVPVFWLWYYTLLKQDITTGGTGEED